MAKFGESSASSLEDEARIFSETERIWAEVIEKGGGMDPQRQAALRQQLYQNLYQLGVLNQDGSINPTYYDDFACQLARRKDTPVKPTNYPSMADFSAKYDVILQENPGYAEIQGRMGQSAHDYLYGVGIVMANKLVYETIFANDPIKVDRDGVVQNGRHRSLARDVLGRTGFVTAGWTWVKTEREE